MNKNSTSKVPDDDAPITVEDVQTGRVVRRQRAADGRVVSGECKNGGRTLRCPQIKVLKSIGLARLANGNPALAMPVAVPPTGSAGFQPARRRPGLMPGRRRLHSGTDRLLRCDDPADGDGCHCHHRAAQSA